MIIWTHEQAIIHKGATKHWKWASQNNFPKLALLLSRIREVSSRVDMYLRANPKSNPELFVINGDKIVLGDAPSVMGNSSKELFFSCTVVYFAVVVVAEAVKPVFGVYEVKSCEHILPLHAPQEYV